MGKRHLDKLVLFYGGIIAFFRFVVLHPGDDSIVMPMGKAVAISSTHTTT